MPEPLVSTSAALSLTLAYSAPMPGLGSRYADGPVAHESRMLAVVPVRDALTGAASRGVGETVLEAVAGARRIANFSDARSVGYLAPLARAALLGLSSRVVLSQMGFEEIAPFVRALRSSGEVGALLGALEISLGAGGDVKLLDAMRYAADRDPLAREYAKGYEITRQLARPALRSAIARSDSARAALVHSYLEVLSEVPDLDVTARAGQKESEEVSRMARGALKAGGVRSRRGLQTIANLDGLLRADSRLAPTATEPPVIAAAFLFSLEHGPDVLSHRVRPATGH